MNKNIFNIFKNNAKSITPDVWENIKNSDEPKLAIANEEQKKRTYPSAMRWVALTACYVFIVGLGVSIVPRYMKNASDTTLDNSVIIENLNQNGELPKFNSFDEMIAHLKKGNSNAKENARNGWYFMNGAEQNFDTAAVEEKRMVPDGASQKSSSDYSSTNTQVSGVDEGDIIKNDGKYLYIASARKVSIVEVYPASELKNIGQIKLADNETISEIYLKDNLLTVIGSKYSYISTNSGGTEPAKGAAEPAQDGVENKAIAPDVYYGGEQTTLVKVYDITDRAAPVIKRELTFDGYVLSTREKDGKFYIITNEYLQQYYNAKNPKPELVLPKYSDSVVSQDSIRIDAQSIEYYPNNLTTNYLIISVFDINNDNPASVETILGAGSNLYMSNNALYIVQPYYRQAQTKSSGDVVTSSIEAVKNAVIDVIAPYDEGTTILKFNITDTGVKFAVAGEVPGQILNQYSMDEYNETFRIATTKWAQNGSINNLYVLNNELKITGKVEGLAQGETIKSVRFVEKTGYIVTYRTMDPLFVIDLSDNTAPKVMGELKIPGFSNYLHPISESKLIGIGANTVEVYTKDTKGNEVVVGTKQSGLKVSLFDVSDPKNPKELDFIAIGGAGSSSVVQNNPKAFLWWSEESTAIFPASIYGEDGSTEYTYDYGSYNEGIALIYVNGNDLVEKGRLIPEAASTNNYYTNTRAAYIDDTVYLSRYGTVYAYDYNTLTESGRLTFDEQTAENNPVQDQRMPD